MFQKEQMSVLDWLLYFILMIIPILNIVMFIVILLNSDTNKSLKNYMILQLILVVLVVFLWIAIGAAILAMLEGLSGAVMIGLF